MKLSVEKTMNYKDQVRLDEPSLYDGMEGRILVKDDDQMVNIIYDPSRLDQMDDQDLKEVKEEMDRIATVMEDKLVKKMTDRTEHWVDELVKKTKSGLEEKFGICYDLMDQEHLSIKIQRRDQEEEVEVTGELLDLTQCEEDVIMDDKHEEPQEESYYTEEEVVELRVSTAPDEECDEAVRFHSVDGEEGTDMVDHPEL